MSETNSGDYVSPAIGQNYSCDACGCSDFPIAEVDPDTEAYVCQRCVDLHEQGVRAAALVLDDEAGHTIAPTIDIARRALDAYFAAVNNASYPSGGVS